MLNFAFFMNLLNFALKNDMPGDPFGKAKDFILDTVNEAIGYPINAPLHADSIDTFVNNDVVHVYQMDIHGPCMLPDTSIRLRIALAPVGWHMHASFRPANGGCQGQLRLRRRRHPKHRMEYQTPRKCRICKK